MLIKGLSVESRNQRSSDDFCIGEPDLAISLDKSFKLPKPADKNAKIYVQLLTSTMSTINQMQHKKFCHQCGGNHSTADCKFDAANMVRRDTSLVYAGANHPHKSLSNMHASLFNAPLML